MASDKVGPLPGQAIIRQLKPSYVKPAKGGASPEWARIKTPQSGPSVGQPPMPGGRIKSPGNDS
jgi:hypothetical protein